jgi:hypothetical protein
MHDFDINEPAERTLQRPRLAKDSLVGALPPGLARFANVVNATLRRFNPPGPCSAASANYSRLSPGLAIFAKSLRFPNQQ